MPFSEGFVSVLLCSFPVFEWQIELRHRRICFDLSRVVQHCFIFRAFVSAIGQGVRNFNSVCKLLNRLLENADLPVVQHVKWRAGVYKCYFRV